MKKGQTVDVPESYYKQAHDDRVRKGKHPLVTKVEQPRYKTKEEKKTYTQKGSWFTVYKNGQQIDRFQGKEGLRKHEL